MSRYFDTLNRLRRGREAAVRPDLHLPEDAEPALGAALKASVRGLPSPELQLASRQASYAVLLDVLRSASKPSSIPAVVIAGVSGEEPIHEVVAGIELQAQKRGISFKCGHLDLATGARILHLFSRHPIRDLSSPGATGKRESFRLSGSQGADALARWIERAAADSELLLIEAPPISSSIEGVLLGQAYGGLVLVAEPLVTKRTTFLEVVERAQTAGCEILGIVLTGSRRWLPEWIERFVGPLGRS